MENRTQWPVVKNNTGVVTASRKCPVAGSDHRGIWKTIDILIIAAIAILAGHASFLIVGAVFGGL